MHSMAQPKFDTANCCVAALPLLPLRAPLLLQSCTFTGACAPVPLMVACVAPFATQPPLQLGYACGAQALNRSLALPVVAVKICTPPDAAVPRETLFQRWRALPSAPAHPRARCRGSPRRARCCCCHACTHPASRACAAGPPQRLGQRVVRAPPALGRAPVEAMLASLSLGVQAGLDPDPDACTQEDSCSASASAACTENNSPH